MKKRDLEKLGVIQGDAQKEAISLASRAKQIGFQVSELKNRLAEISKSPEDFVKDPVFSKFATLSLKISEEPSYTLRSIPYAAWGEDIDEGAHEQMRNACSLPVTIAGALMPDAHLGYGLPIGGVLATEKAVIPYAVGVDIACRVKISVVDIPGHELARRIAPLSQAIEKNTRFGIGAEFQHPKTHPVMDEDWGFSKYVGSLKNKAWRQLGTSGSGNHFVEFGVLEISPKGVGYLAERSKNGALQPGEYLALVSHSGSRGPGAMIANHFSRLARDKHPKLPKKLQHLAWLETDEAEGEEYWNAMELMGRYASANHALIHRDVLKAAGGELLFSIENHHNFAWKERYQGKEVIVHRKGATPAGAGELGYIPGTMIAPGFIVAGQGNPKSLSSSAHGAGRVMSRKAAKQRITPSGLKKLTQASGVTLLDAGLDEAPIAYKDIQAVMAAQHELVDIIGVFTPKIVKMAPDGEDAED